VSTRLRFRNGETAGVIDVSTGRSARADSRPSLDDGNHDQTIDSAVAPPRPPRNALGAGRRAGGLPRSTTGDRHRSVTLEKQIGGPSGGIPGALIGVAEQGAPDPSRKIAGLPTSPTCSAVKGPQMKLTVIREPDTSGWSPGSDSPTYGNERAVHRHRRVKGPAAGSARRDAAISRAGAGRSAVRQCHARDAFSSDSTARLPTRDISHSQVGTRH